MIEHSERIAPGRLQSNCVLLLHRVGSIACSGRHCCSARRQEEVPRPQLARCLSARCGALRAPAARTWAAANARSCCAPPRAAPPRGERPGRPRRARRWWPTRRAWRSGATTAARPAVRAWRCGWQTRPWPTASCTATWCSCGRMRGGCGPQRARWALPRPCSAARGANLPGCAQGTASTLTRAEVRGGGRKPYAQKGTGNARMGSMRTPLRPGGGVVFGPKVRAAAAPPACLLAACPAVAAERRAGAEGPAVRRRAADGLDNKDEQEGEAPGHGNGAAERRRQHHCRRRCGGARPCPRRPPPGRRSGPGRRFPAPRRRAFGLTAGAGRRRACRSRRPSCWRARCSAGARRRAAACC